MRFNAESAADLSRTVYSPAVFCAGGAHMWTIRLAQLEALASARQRELENRAIAFLRREFPEAEALAEQRLRESVDIALRKGETYRFGSEQEVRSYLELMFLLGFDFDEQPRFAWARQTLTDFELGPGTRLEILVDEARARMRRARRQEAGR